MDGTGGAFIPHSVSLDSLPTAFTFSAWIYSTSFPDFTTVFWKTDRYNRIHQLHFQVDGRLYAAMNGLATDGTGFEGIGPYTVGLNEWHYVAWTYDLKFFRFYDNGAEVFNAPFSDPWPGNNIDLLIGYHPEISTANFRGLLDEARIYRGALSLREIIRDMNSGAGSSATATSQPALDYSTVIGTYYEWDRSRSLGSFSDEEDSFFHKKRRKK